MPSPRPPAVIVSRGMMLGSGGNILLVQRAMKDSHHPGLWEFPGGKLDEGQDHRRALEDECEQETGFLVDVIHRLATVDSYQIVSGNYAGHIYFVVFGVVKVVGGDLKLSDEHDNALWVPPQDVLNFDLTPETRKAFKILRGLIPSAG